MVADGRNRCDLTGAVSACGAQSDELGTRATGEAIEVHPSDHASVNGTHGRAHVCPVLIRAGVGVVVDGRSSKLNDLLLVFGQVSGRWRKRHVRHDGMRLPAVRLVVRRRTASASAVD
jgi:hypothetical protein